MTQPSDRAIPGLGPKRRRPMDASSLVAPRVPSPEVMKTEVKPPVQQPVEQEASNTGITGKASDDGNGRIAGAAADGVKQQLSAYVSAELRARARTAYQATSFAEGDDSWSHLVEKALETEVRRREVLYNGGEQYVGTNRKLAPGRSVRG